ncbi:hypothetical protein [Ferrovibrio sp.]|uniref:hypothetical protein n=1 Tax=Ferrovibrio sp. TaxID=1917215 RepID=UPI0025BBCEC0|nr:hypothetical protein [Ferrovibrio sp.]MBX3453498.1 hypothetical protein [Ferrovibrio sp.]
MANTRRPAIFKKKLCGHVALAGIAAAILLALSFALDWPHSSVSTEKYRQYKLAKNADPRDQDAARESRVWLGRVLEAGRPEVANKKDEAAKPDSEEYTTALDLSAQWSTAIAAAEMVELTRLQLLFGLAGLIGLGFTIYYARKGADAAISAAKAGADGATAAINAATAAAESLRISKLSERPWIGVEIEPLQIFDQNNAKIEFKIVNYGRLPAIIDESNIGINYGRVPEVPILDVLLQISIGPESQTKTLESYPPQNLQFKPVYFYRASEDRDIYLYSKNEPILSPNENIYFYAVIGYRSVTGERGISSFCWRYEIMSEQWVKHGNDILNFMR